jgi:hypothetical protein
VIGASLEELKMFGIQLSAEWSSIGEVGQDLVRRLAALQLLEDFNLLDDASVLTRLPCATSLTWPAIPPQSGLAIRS